MSLLIKSAFEKVTENYGKLSVEEKKKFLNSLKPQEEVKEVEEEEEEVKEVEEEEEEETSTQEKEPVEAETEKEEADKEDEDGKFDEFSRMLDKYFETHKETKKSFGLGEKQKDYGNGKQKTYQEALNEAFKGR